MAANSLKEVNRLFTKTIDDLYILDDAISIFF